MKIRSIGITNVRSFLDRTLIDLNDSQVIFVGPNGGGKTNLLDITTVVLRKHLLKGWNLRPWRSDAGYRSIEQLAAFGDERFLEAHVDGKGDRTIELEVEVTAPDYENLKWLKDNWQLLDKEQKELKDTPGVAHLNGLKIADISTGQALRYVIRNGGIVERTPEPAASLFLEYLSNFDLYATLQSMARARPLSLPLLSFPVTRGASAPGSLRVPLASYTEFDHRRSIDEMTSRSGGGILTFALGRLATKHFELFAQDVGQTDSRFRADPDVKSLTQALESIGYGWELKRLNQLTNEYEIRLVKGGTSFSLERASSGERELLTFVFGIYALQVRDAVVLIDEPELHLHPKWQRMLLDLLGYLSKDTNSQFIMATHSPMFITPASIKHVSRIYIENRQSKVRRLTEPLVSDQKHLITIINSQNNEKLFFADQVVLVEGSTDRIVFERVINDFRSPNEKQWVVEVLEVNGKGLFEAYGTLLSKAHIQYHIIADHDYLEEVGGGEIAKLFVVDEKAIKKDVLQNPKSLDRTALFSAMESAIKSGNADELRQIWDYIKKTRKQIKEPLDATEATLIKQTIEKKRSEGVLILSMGTLEAYLPEGLRDKNIAKLVSWVEGANYWQDLSQQAREEFELIARTILGKRAKP